MPLRSARNDVHNLKNLVRIPDAPSCRENCAHVINVDIDKIVSLMPGFVYVYNHEKQANEYTNRSVASYLGYSSEEIRAYGEEMLMRIVYPDDLPDIFAHFARIAALGPSETVSLEYRVLTKTGDVTWLRSVDRVFEWAEDGSVSRHIGCATDITAEKNAELRLAELNTALEREVEARTLELALLNEELEERIADRTAELAETSDELEQLTFAATHDLKVPINNLCRIAHSLEQDADELDAEWAEQIDWIGRCAEQLNAKLSGLVLVAQLRLKGGLPMQDLSWRDAVASALESRRKELRRTGARVTCDVPRGKTVRFSSLEMESIISSILENAIHYAHPDRPLRLKIQLREDANALHLSIADNGTGIDTKRDLPKVFGLFQRAHVTPSGNGVSLHCARRMLQRGGGDISVTGEAGHGATFTINLPIGAAS